MGEGLQQHAFVAQPKGGSPNIDYLNSLDNPDDFDDLDDWSDDIDLFVEGLLNPHMIDELWRKSKAKKMWNNFQSGLHN